MSKVYINPLPVRIWHWINAAGFLLLIASGLQMRYLDLFHWATFQNAVAIHNWTGFVLIGNYFLWLGFYLFSDKIEVYHPEMNPLKYFRASLRQLRYYGFGIFKGEPNPHHANAYCKFNALQTMAYQIVMMLLVPVQFFTGLLLWDIEGFSSMVELFGGLRVVDTVHVLIFIFFCGFIFIHPYLASLSETPWSHYRSMLTGYEEIDAPQGEDSIPARPEAQDGSAASGS